MPHKFHLYLIGIIRLRLSRERTENCLYMHKIFCPSSQLLYPVSVNFSHHHTVKKLQQNYDYILGSGQEFGNFKMLPITCKLVYKAAQLHWI